MPRRHKHDEHINHEAWAIPYGDLITLLLAFFVVMYAISTVNEGKYRAVSDSLSAAFNGPPRVVDPIQVGAQALTKAAADAAPVKPQGHPLGQNASLLATANNGKPTDTAGMTPADALISKVEQSMTELIQQDKLIVRRSEFGVEIEIRTDILFPSGSAVMSMSATDVLQKLADVLKTFSFPMRVEGHTDNRPINTTAFPTNWELSAARAASVVRLFVERGIDATRLTVVGNGQFHPTADNASEAGRNLNRRVLVVIATNNSSETASAGSSLKSELNQASGGDTLPVNLAQPAG